MVVGRPGGKSACALLKRLEGDGPLPRADWRPQQTIGEILRFPAPPVGLPLSRHNELGLRIASLTCVAGLSGLPQLSVPGDRVDGRPGRSVACWAARIGSSDRRPREESGGRPTTDLAPNRPEIVEEVRIRFERYERALVEKEVAVLDDTFWRSPHTIRYALRENGYGFDGKRYERPTLPTRGPPCSQLDAELKFQGNSSRMRECGWPAAIFSSVLLSQA